MRIHTRHSLLISCTTFMLAFSGLGLNHEAHAARSKSKKAKAVQTKHDPTKFVASQAQKVLSSLKSRPLRLLEVTDQRAPLVVEEPSRVGWLKAVYSKSLIEASPATQLLSDKRIFAEIIEKELKEKARTYYPKTLGLREFLVKHKFVNAAGKITAAGEQIEAALFTEFPAGFVVRPAVGVAPRETGRGMYPESDQFIVDLLKPNSSLYSPIHRKPVKSSILGVIASGEAVVLQEHVILVAESKSQLKRRYFQEVRVHTYEGRVVEDAIPERWVQTNILGEQEVRQAEKFVADFLAALPLSFLSRQAFGVDVAMMDNGEMRIVDIVTNRGRTISWSGYLDQPRVIGAYSRHFESHYGMRFQGWSGTLIRNNFANYMPFWQKRIEKAKPGWSKVTAYLPPLP